MNKKANAILQFIKDNNGNLEEYSLRDIGEKIGVGRKASIVSHYLEKLEKHNKIMKVGERRYMVLKVVEDGGMEPMDYTHWLDYGRKYGYLEKLIDRFCITLKE